MNGAHTAPATILGELPLRDAVAKTRRDRADFEAMLDWFATPDGFDDWGYAKDGDRFAVPVLIVDAWYDQAVQSALALANLMGKSAPSVQTIIPPGTHCDTNGPFPSGTLGDMSVSTAAGKSLDDTYVAFMAHHLRGGAPPNLPKFTTYVMGEDRWLETSHWPPKQAVETTWNLSGQQLGAAVAGVVASRSFTSDPTNPVPTIGRAICCTGDPNLRTGPLFQNPIEDRSDVLLFTSAPLAESMRSTAFHACR
jgi:putative CocE/NonD family hydrolase